jgi:hypothetical protein
MQRIFGTEALDLNQWLVCLALGSIVLWVIEILKIFRRRAAARAEHEGEISGITLQGQAA